LTIATTSACSAATATIGPSSFVSEMKETSTTMRSGRNGSSSGTI
jgi:hypothetical protein